MRGTVAKKLRKKAKSYTKEMKNLNLDAKKILKMLKRDYYG